MHHQEVPGAASGRQGPGLRRGVQAAAQRQAANRTAHAGPAGTFHQAADHIQSSQTGSLICPSVSHDCGIGELNFHFASPAKEIKKLIGRDSDNDDTSRA